MMIANRQSSSYGTSKWSLIARSLSPELAFEWLAKF